MAIHITWSPSIGHRLAKGWVVSYTIIRLAWLCFLSLSRLRILLHTRHCWPVLLAGNHTQPIPFSKTSSHSLPPATVPHPLFSLPTPMAAPLPAFSPFTPLYPRKSVPLFLSRRNLTSRRLKKRICASCDGAPIGSLTGYGSRIVKEESIQRVWRGCWPSRRRKISEGGSYGGIWWAGQACGEGQCSEWGSPEKRSMNKLGYPCCWLVGRRYVFEYG